MKHRWPIYDEGWNQNVVYFNDLFPFNIIYPDDLKLDKGNDDNEIDMIQSSRGNESTQGSNELLKASHNKINKVLIMRSFVMELNVNVVAWNHLVNGMLFNLIKNLYVSFGILFDPKRYYKDGDCARMLRRPRAIRHMAPLPPHDQRHLWLCYQVAGYTEEIVHDFEQRLETIFDRQVNRVHILDFEGLTPDMRQDLAERMRMVYTRDDRQENRRRDVAGTLCFQLGGVMRSMTWRQFILALGLHTADEMAKDKFGTYWDFLRGAPLYTYIRDPVQRLCHRLISYNISGRGQTPEKVNATNLFYLRSMDRGAANIPYLLAQYLFRHAEGRNSGARLSGGHFIGRLAHHFGLVSDDGLRGLSVVAHELPLIDMGELAAEDALTVDEGAQADPAPVQAPQPPPPPPAAGRTMP
ncbi:hypothetical protein Tco_0757380 [Tanacetum coccineum]